MVDSEVLLFCPDIDYFNRAQEDLVRCGFSWHVDVRGSRNTSLVYLREAPPIVIYLFWRIALPYVLLWGKAIDGPGAQCAPFVRDFLLAEDWVSTVAKGKTWLV